MIINNITEIKYNDSKMVKISQFMNKKLIVLMIIRL